MSTGNVAVIPARGGSKRIPRKNIRPFAGKPLIAHAIGCALGCGVFDQVVVSTDDEEITRVSRAFGADVPFPRPPELSDDHAGTAEVMAHAVAQLLQMGARLSAVCCIYATPLIHQDDIRRALAVLDAGTWQYVFPATAFTSSIFRSFRHNGAEGLEMLFPDHLKTRSQDLPEALHDAGQFYWGRPEAWLNKVTDIDEHSTVIRIPHWRVQDIDSEEDWARAEMIAALMGVRERSQSWAQP